MTLLFVAVVAAVGLGTLFVAPWIGGALLLAAVILGAVGVFWAGANAEDIAKEKKRDEPETPHLRGPAS
jgi:hypothetical protein